MKKKVPVYVSEIIKKYPSILSGRKNTKKYSERIFKTKRLIKDFVLKKKLKII